MVMSEFEYGCSLFINEYLGLEHALGVFSDLIFSSKVNFVSLFDFLAFKCLAALSDIHSLFDLKCRINVQLHKRAEL